MQYAITREHREHFRREGFVEFEEVLSPVEIIAIQRALQGVLPDPISSAGDALQSGRDLWRQDPALRKTACARRLGSVAAQLIETGPLRLAYDQLLGFGRHQEHRQEMVQFFQKPWSVAERSAFQGVSCGLLLSLADGESETPFLPKKAGHGVYVNAEHLFDWKELLTAKSLELWLLVYGLENMVYIRNSNDPHVHRPKQYGYAFGDRLLDEDFPIVAVR